MTNYWIIFIYLLYLGIICLAMRIFWIVKLYSPKTMELNLRIDFLGLGAKYAKDSAFFNVDYVFAFDICQNQFQTLIQWNIAVINFDLCDIFKPL